MKQATHGHKTNIWKAVKVAKDLCPSDIPTNLALGGLTVPAGTFANCFAEHFHRKEKINVEKTKGKSSVYECHGMGKRTTYSKLVLGLMEQDH